ncbi:PAS domain S-box protein [Tsuneonella sp. HG094]
MLEIEYAAILDQVTEGIIVADASGKLTFVNQAAARLHGMGKLDIEPDQYSNAYRLFTDQGDPYPSHALPLARAVRGETVFDARWRVRRPDGVEILAVGSARPVFDSEGTQIGAVLTARDDTARDIAEREVRESEARLRALTNNLPGVVVYQLRTDAQGQERRFLYVSETHKEMTGVTADQVMADATIPYRMVHPDDQHRMMEAGARAIRDKAPYDIEVRYRKANGEERWSRAISVPREQADGSLIWDGLQIDITDRVAAQQALSEANRTLEDRVLERTAELMEAQEALRQSQKMDAMGQLTGGVAHDFNNLLTPIIGSLDRLQRKDLGDDRDRQLIDGAMQSAERARMLVQRLLAFARRQPLQTSAVDIRTLMEGLTELLKSTIGPRIGLDLEIAEHLPAAAADENQIEMALLNLAVNARDAMPEGGTLTIGAEVVSADDNSRADLHAGDYVRISVTDTGTGMDDATLTRAVEPFFSTKGVGQGTGLGLSMVHGLAAQLGGALSIFSQIAQGTRMEFFVPVSGEVAQISDVPRVAEAVSRTGTVLLVDDEPLIRLSTTDMLNDLGYDVIDAGSAEDALRLVSEGGHFDILVTDHLMPGLSGVELASKLRAANPELPVLIVSGYAEIQGVAASIPRLVKPFRLAELASKLEELLAETR